MKIAVRVVGITLLSAVLLVAIQLMMTLSAADSAREAAIMAWVEAHPDQVGVVAHYRDCRHTRKDQLKDQSPQPMSFPECAELAGSPSLAQAIEEAVESIEVPAPLRWL